MKCFNCKKETKIRVLGISVNINYENCNVQDQVDDYHKEVAKLNNNKDRVYWVCDDCNMAKRMWSDIK